MRLFSEHLAHTCTLTIASNDPALAERQLPPGVQLLRGKNREQLLDVYQQSDIFVFPTLQDYTPEVVAEALAVGLPCLVNDVDGARDLVRDGETGFLISRDAPTHLWAERIQRLATDPGELARMSHRARHFAEEMLSLEHFDKLVANVIDRLRSDNNNHSRASIGSRKPGLFS